MPAQPIGIYAEQTAKREALVAHMSPAARHAHFPRLYAKPVPIPSTAESMRAELGALTRKCAELEAANFRLKARIELLEARQVQTIEIPLTLSQVPTGKQLVQFAAAVTGLSVEIMEGASRSRTHTYPRHFAIWLVRECRWDLTLQQIAWLFGNRDHTTIIHALKNVAKQRDSSPFKGWIEDPRIQGVLATQAKSAETDRAGAP